MPQNSPEIDLVRPRGDDSTCISAVALVTADMAASLRFYRALGFTLTYGGEGAAFSTLRCGHCFVNLAQREIDVPVPWWGRVIFHVADVDAIYDKAVASGFDVEAPPRDASWGERYFHVTDPAGHQLSFATPL